MPDNSEATIATADVLTLLLQNQHTLAAALEEVTKRISENGVQSVAANAMGALEKLNNNALAFTDAIMRLTSSRHDQVAGLRGAMLNPLFGARCRRGEVWNKRWLAKHPVCPAGPLSK